MVGPVHDLVGADAVGVVHELQERLAAVSAHLLELAAVPVLPLPAERIALRVVCASAIGGNGIAHSIFDTTDFRQAIQRSLCFWGMWHMAIN